MCKSGGGGEWVSFAIDPTAAGGPRPSQFATFGRGTIEFAGLRDRPTPGARVQRAGGNPWAGREQRAERRLRPTPRRSPTETARRKAVVPTDGRGELYGLFAYLMIDEFDAPKSQGGPISIDRDLSNGIEAGLP